MYKSESESHSAMSDSLWPYGLYSPWNSPGQNTEMGSLSLLQGIFPTQRLNPHLPHCWWILYQLRRQGSPRILELVAYPFSSGSSWPRNRTGVSCIAREFFTSWGTREAQHPGSQWKILADNVRVYSSLKTVRQTDRQSVSANEYWVMVMIWWRSCWHFWGLTVF